MGLSSWRQTLRKSEAASGLTPDRCSTASFSACAAGANGTDCRKNWGTTAQSIAPFNGGWNWVSCAEYGEPWWNSALMSVAFLLSLIAALAEIPPDQWWAQALWLGGAALLFFLWGRMVLRPLIPPTSGWANCCSGLCSRFGIELSFLGEGIPMPTTLMESSLQLKKASRRDSGLLERLFRQLFSPWSKKSSNRAMRSSGLEPTNHPIHRIGHLKGVVNGRR